MSLVATDGSETRLSRTDSGTSATVADASTVRFVLERPLDFGMGTDIAVFATGMGRLSVSVYRTAGDRTALASATFTLRAGLPGELRLRVPDGATVAALELRTTAGATATLSGFAAMQAFVGFRFDSGSYIVDGGTSPVIDASGKTTSIALAPASTAGVSMVVALESGGAMEIASLDAHGKRGAVFEAVMHAGAPLAIPMASLGAATRFVVESKAGLVQAIVVDGRGAPLSDLYAMLDAPGPSGDYSLYRWDLLPGTLVLDFKDYDTQDRYLKRLAFFAEKPGFRGKLATDGEIAALHGWNAHDYSTKTLADFYAKARVEGFRLNADENAFLDLLLSYGVLEKGSGDVPVTGHGAVISIARESSDALRKTFLDHEASHALFFQDEAYRALAADLWDSLSRESRWFWMIHFAWRRYDTADRYLDINEMQAYLVQQSLRSLPLYFEAVARKLAEAYPAYLPRIEADAPAVIVEAASNAARLDAYLRDRWGLAAGRFGRTRNLSRH
ncbi:MAG: hypothetical protein CVV51_06220 [Spirochaetae bacterium HGW-Spirochaetae-7]|nr:MAG: hypothetical protein CVV51_06220 [Spirochaetae bacterium HGW-Spirochaetae-7]